MRTTSCCMTLMALVLVLCTPEAAADLLPPAAVAAGARLRDNPNAFDRSDQFCKDKKPGDVCAIDLSRLAGGGQGVCRNDVNPGGTIDLHCDRVGYLSLYRGLPSGGFVADEDLCRNAAPGKKLPYNCAPFETPPADRFCRGKEVGASCTVSMEFDGKPEQQQGVCKQIVEREQFYYMGRRSATRTVIVCEATDRLERVWSDATWWQKLRQ